MRGRVLITGASVAGNAAAWWLMGRIDSTLAITGGYVLASELARTQDLPAAFAAYESAMRPMVMDGQ